MTDLEKTIESLKARIDSMRQSLEDEFTGLATGCEAARDAVDELRHSGDTQLERLRELEDRTSGQNEIIEALRQEAEDSSVLRDQIRDRDREIEKLASELESKTELVQALRQQTRILDEIRTAAEVAEETVVAQQQELDELNSAVAAAEEKIAAQQQELDAAKSAAEAAEAKIEAQQVQLDESKSAAEAAAEKIAAVQQEREAAESRAAVLHSEIDTLRSESAESLEIDRAELLALRTELDSRKTMIRSLKEDAGRTEALESQLEAKRETIRELEQSVEKYMQANEDLRQSIDAWRRKYQAAKGQAVEQDSTLAEPPLFTDTEIQALEEIESAAAESEVQETLEAQLTPAEHTVAIDMREALTEARDQKKARNAS